MSRFGGGAFHHGAGHRGPGRSFGLWRKLLALAALTCLWAALLAVAQAHGAALLPQPPPQPPPQQQGAPPATVAQAAAQAPAPVENQVGPLEPGKPIERALKGGETDVYQVKLKSGEFLYVVAEQKGVDVVVVLVAPDGKSLVESDSINGAWGPESAALVAEVSGVYSVKIRSFDKSAAPGKYELRIVARRKPTAEDRQRIDAQRAFLLGMQLRDGKDLEVKKQALAKFEEAVPLWRSVKDSYCEALTLYTAALLYDEIGPRKRALEDYEAALPILRQRGDDRLLAPLLNAIGFDQYQLDEDDKALESYTESLALYRKLGDRHNEAGMLVSIGDDCNDWGEPAKALEYYSQALEIYRALPDRDREGNVLSSMANSHRIAGEWKESLELRDQVIAIRRERHDRDGEASELNKVGVIYSSMGDRQKSLDFYQQALAIYREEKSAGGEAQVLDNIGDIYEGLSQWDKALEYYEKALAIRRSLHNRSAEATILSDIGEVYDSRGERTRALEYYEKALAIREEIGDHSGKASSLLDMGSVYSGLGDRDKALEYYEKALAIRVAENDRAGQATVFLDMGKLYDDLGQKQKSLEYYEKALAIRRDLHNLPGQAVLLNNMGKVYDDLGDRQKALDYYSQALPLRQKIGDRSGEANTLHNIGGVYAELGEKEKGLGYLTQALAIQKEIGEHDSAAMSLNNIGEIYAELNDRTNAFDYYNQALEIFRSTGNKEWQGTVLANIGVSYFDSGAQDKALYYYEQALPLERAVGDRTAEATTLNAMGVIYDDRGDRKKALDYYQQSLPLRRSVGDRKGEAVTLSNIGILLAATGEKDKALSSYMQALALTREVRDPIAEGQVLADLMTYYQTLDQAPLAIFFGKQAVNSYQQVRGNITGMATQTQKSFLQGHSQVYRELADLLIDENRLPEALQVLDLLKDEEYFEYTGRRARGISAPTSLLGLIPRETVSLKHFQEFLKVEDNVISAGFEADRLNRKKNLSTDEQQHLAADNHILEIADRQVKEHCDALYVELKETGGRESADREVSGLNGQLHDLQVLVGQLGPGTVALYTVAAKKELHIIVITPNAIVARQSAITSRALVNKVADVIEMLKDPRTDPKPLLKQLYDVMIAPIEKDLAGAQEKNPKSTLTLMWHLDGGLQYLPVAALYDGKQYLVEKYRNTVFRGTAHLNEPPHVKAWTGLGMGVCRPAPDLGLDAALLSVPGELHRIIRGTGAGTRSGVMPGELLIDESFSRDGMVKALGKHPPVIHIASHFVLAPGSEGDSFLLLGPSSKPGEDRRLTLDQLGGSRSFSFAGAELVTLSACDTAGGGRSSNGKEMDSLAQDVEDKGAKAVVASLWDVDDDSTGLLMADFYRRWIGAPGMTKVEALRQAQLDLLLGRGPKVAADKSGASEMQRCATASGQPEIERDPNASFAHPHFWAPFVLYGNWQ
ncbi:MAG TPA: tetratricopeptide repeat protein [Candidatus Acidoferrales bacterium]|jgi:tetratricopeptide (TPR) repeat protein/CHAT domain-containing protein|nr:tetratricopeptide repeat protein [Candidatus Acidoferrales bacterium]